MLLNELIKKIRKERNLTTRQFAELVGLTNSYISQIERNQSAHKKEINLTLNTIKQICNGLNYPLKRFLEEAEYIEKEETKYTAKNEMEQELMENYRKLNEDNQSVIKDIIIRLVEAQELGPNEI